MPTGFLKFQVSTAEEALPVDGAKITVTDKNETVLSQILTDISGEAGPIALYAPAKELALDPATAANSYSLYNVKIESPDYVTRILEGVGIFDGETAIVQADLHPVASVSDDGVTRHGSGGEEIFDVSSPPAALSRGANDQELPTSLNNTRILKDVIIPEYITVHLGPYSTHASNVKVKFKDYIKRVASSEIFSTWPLESLIANILAQISLTLNRVYTEWYRGRGYNFDITSSTATDQAYNMAKPIYESISEVVDEIFNQYIRRVGFKEPFYAEYCNGSTSTCPGMSQWGTVTLANQGKNAMQILRSYYPKDIELVTTDRIEELENSYPGYTLKEGSKSSDVRSVQLFLNRIAANYPAIPVIKNTNGEFGSDTAAAVKEFQKIFNLPQTGQVDSMTWYKIGYIYTAVKKLAELTSEGIREGIGANPPNALLKLGDRGENVVQLQYILDFLSVYYSNLPTVVENSRFDSVTENAVKAFQSSFGLTPDGIVGPGTWSKLYEIYKKANHELIPMVPAPPGGGLVVLPYPETVLKVGSKGDNVKIMQQYLNDINKAYPNIPQLTADGVFGAATEAAVIEFQKLFGLTPDGMIGRNTWNSIVNQRDQIVNSTPTTPSVPPSQLPQYPGHLLQIGSQGAAVKTIQEYLNHISFKYTSLPKVSVDGIFGSGTKKAVIEFQKLFGLTPDGIVGSETWNAIINAGEEHSNSGGSEGGNGGGSVPSEPSPTYPGYVLKVGSRGDAVKIMQQYLNDISKNNANLPQITADGIFGEGTKSAVIAFQKLFGLTSDGMIGPATWQAIVNAKNKSAVASKQYNYQQPLSPTQASSEASDVKYFDFNGNLNDTSSCDNCSSMSYGVRGDNVKTLQKYLNEIASVYPSIPKPIVDGIYGSMTQAAVTAFQQLHDLKPTGAASPETWALILALFKELYPRA